MQNLHELPRFADKISYLYTEHAVIDRQEKAIAVHREDGTIQVPAASLAVLILGPGTKITHAAIKTLGENNCQVIWAGEHGVRFYANGLGGARYSRNLIRQAKLVSDEQTRLQVVIRMYCMRFEEEIDPGLTLQQLRGKEGIRVRKAYADASGKYGIEWKGRLYNRDKWDFSDPINRALSAANACLYGLVHAAILSGGYSPALGFVHTGKQLSFVYDIADLYKVDYTIPIAFSVAAKYADDIEREVRITCRDHFHNNRLMERILPDIASALDVVKDIEDEYAVDAACPSQWWEPKSLDQEMPIGQIVKIHKMKNLPYFGVKSDDNNDLGKGKSISER